MKDSAAQRLPSPSRSRTGQPWPNNHRRPALPPRSDETMSDGVNYISLETADTLQPDCVILLRNRNWLDRVGATFPAARHFFWMHNMPSRRLYDARATLIKYHYEIIAVSQFHQEQIKKRVHGKWFQRLLKPTQNHLTVPVHVLYNPIDDLLDRNDTLVNPNKLFLASTPYKGLNATLDAFSRLLSHCPNWNFPLPPMPAGTKNKHCHRGSNFSAHSHRRC